MRIFVNVFCRFATRSVLTEFQRCSGEFTIETRDSDDGFSCSAEGDEQNFFWKKPNFFPRLERGLQERRVAGGGGVSAGYTSPAGGIPVTIAADVIVGFARTKSRGTVINRRVRERFSAQGGGSIIKRYVRSSNATFYHRTRASAPSVRPVN